MKSDQIKRLTTLTNDYIKRFSLYIILKKHCSQIGKIIHGKNKWIVLVLNRNILHLKTIEKN